MIIQNLIVVEIYKGTPLYITTFPGISYFHLNLVILIGFSYYLYYFN